MVVPVVTWTESMSVGVPMLDEHHKKLIALLNELHTVLQTHDNEQVGRVLTELVAYTRYHFAEEERQMELAGYSGLAMHRLCHCEIVGHLHEFEAEYARDPRTVIVAELFEFVSDWLIHHILGEDLLYRPALAQPA